MVENLECGFITTYFSSWARLLPVDIQNFKFVAVKHLILLFLLEEMLFPPSTMAKPELKLATRTVNPGTPQHQLTF